MRGASYFQLCCLFCAALWMGGSATPVWSAEKTPSPPTNPYQPYMQRIRAQLQREPRSARLHTILGRLYQRAGQWKKAEAAYRTALRCSKRYSHALVGLAHLSLREGKADQARRYLRQVLRRDPNHAPALAKQSEWYRWQAMRTSDVKRRRKLLLRAGKDLQKALQQRPRSHQYRYRLGLLYLALHQHFQAHRQFVLAVTLRSIHPCYHVGAHMSEAMLVRKERAYQKLRVWLPRCHHPLMAQMAQRVWISNEIQKVQRQAALGQLKAAIQRLQKSIKLAPNAPSGYLYLTLLLSQDQRCWEARKVLRRLLRRIPNHTEAKKLLRHSRALRCKPASRSRLRTRTSVRLLRVTPRSSVPQPSSPPVRRRTATP